ncbi:MAG TPA: hypothetical protein VFL99_13920 [Segeticoccus sp.]|uniref:hypothetical protein n=1 Tax=Segeticoccus sp. TaxID=2706531 RepID=UPI002D7F12EA|nr:hypothetical protein [Segeticoccus sp.]HET8601421.1 hypothetical protein [Segeticoccus sp.]
MNTTGRQRIGLVLALVLSAGNIVSLAAPTPEGEVGPPLLVLVVGAVLGIAGVVASILAWRSGNRVVLLILACLLILMALGAVPGLFVAIPPALKVAVAVTVVLTIAAVALVLSRPVGHTVAKTAA